jgi:SHS2 domain-containing protein
MRFELLDHPADIGFRAFGGTLPELFANAAGAMLSIAADTSNVRGSVHYDVSATGVDYESLLVNWLNEVLYWFDGKQVLFREFRIHELKTTGVRATALGEARDQARHPAKVIVKAVTYHQLRVARDGAGWVAEVYLDV